MFKRRDEIQKKATHVMINTATENTVTVLSRNESVCLCCFTPEHFYCCGQVSSRKVTDP